MVDRERGARGDRYLYTHMHTRERERESGREQDRQKEKDRLEEHKGRLDDKK